MQDLATHDTLRPITHRRTLMVDSDTEDLLREFLGKERKAEKEGYTREAFFKSVNSMMQALDAHQRDCSKRWDENERRHKSAEHRLQTLEAAQLGVKPSNPPPAVATPDDPAEITSSHRLDDIAAKVKQATIESLRVPGADPETAIRKVVAEEQEALEKRAELKRLRQDKEARDAAAATEAKERRERNRLIVVGIVGTVGGSGILWAIQQVASHFH